MELRVFLKTCVLLVFGIVLIEICFLFGLCFSDFCCVDCLFFQILWHLCCFSLLLKAICAFFCENILILGLFFRMCLPIFLFGFPANFLFCWIFLPNAYWACFSVKLPVLVLFLKFTYFCKITWHHCFTPCVQYAMRILAQSHFVIGAEMPLLMLNCNIRLMFSGSFLMFDVYATNLMLKTILIFQAMVFLFFASFQR